MRSHRVLTAGLTASLLLTGCTGTGQEPEAADRTGSAAPTTSPSPTPPPTPPPPPVLQVEILTEGLDNPWDVAQAPDGTLLLDERPGGFTVIRPDGTVQPVEADFADLYAQGETGLMGLVLDPAFEENRRFYSCQGRQQDDGRSVAVVAWTVDEQWRTATRVADPLVGGIPVNEQTGRHGGCRLRFAPDGNLLIGTGDNAVGTHPQDLGSLAGKVLRVDAATGQPARGNPFTDRPEPAARFVWTYGHRNVQGLVVRPGSGHIFAVEHGPDRDDEVNLIDPGLNYGWNPVGEGVYDESVPMTDTALPGVRPAVWSSGTPSVAPSGATFLDGEQWAAYDGLLLLALLRGQGVLALRLDDAGRPVEEFGLSELDGTYGRVRTVQQGGDGALYVTTDNGADGDLLLRVTPQ